MADKILIRPEELQEEISSAKNAIGQVQGVKYAVETNRTILTSIDKYKDCVSLLNEAIQDFATLLDSDVKNLEAIKAEWLKLDQITIDKIFKN